MRRRALLPLLPLLLAAPNATARAAPAGSESVVARAFVPSPEQKVGEVRLIRRADTDVVETLLYTKILSRVIREIRSKELRNWGEGVPGHDDAVRYVETLERVQRAIWDRVPRDAVARDRRQRMWVDFVLSPREARVATGTFEMEESGGEVRVLRRETLAELELSRRYVRRNMRLIAADSFGVDGPALDALLEPLAGLRAEATEDRP